MVKTIDDVSREKFFLGCNGFPAPFPSEVAEKLRGTFARICLNEHFVTVTSWV